jgi:hypothetical protein
MRKSCRFAVVLIAALGLAGAARGAVLSSASISIPMALPMTVLVPTPISGTGVGTSVGAGAAARLGANVVTGTVATGASGLPITGATLSLTGHAAGSFVAGGGPGAGLGGPMTLGGGFRAVAYAGLVTLVNVPLSPVGQPGGFYSMTGAGGTITQAWGTGWTTGSWTLMAPATTISGLTTTPRTVTATGADLRTASGAGTLVLISPMFFRSNLAGDGLNFATLTLNYVPEPGTLLLVGLGIAVLALRGRRRH